MGEPARIDPFDPSDGALEFSFVTRAGNLIFTAGCHSINLERWKCPTLSRRASLTFQNAS